MILIQEKLFSSNELEPSLLFLWLSISIINSLSSMSKIIFSGKIQIFKSSGIESFTHSAQ